MTFSVIIPSYNEGEDIRLSIESALAQTVSPLEVLVVDDSSDNTPGIIREYADRGVAFIEGPHKGCCGARNLGMRRAKGDIVLLLNADVILPVDFLERVERYYLQGADYVLVESDISNPEDYLARFVQAHHELMYRGRTDLQWTEGFTARRSALAKVGYIPGDYKPRFCRDWLLGQRLADAGFRKVMAPEIMVRHKSPGALGEFWRVRVARGRFAALTQYYIYGRSRGFLAFKFLVKDALALLKDLTLVVPLIQSARLARRSPRGAADVLPFLWAYLVQEAARVIGEWQGFPLMQRV